MTQQRISRSRTLAVLAALSAVPARASAQAASRPLTIGVISKTASDWPTFVAEKYGIFAANGIAPDIIVAGSAAASAQQLAGNSLELAEISTTQLVLSIVGGAPIVSVVNRAVAVPYFLVVKKGITSVAQLKGKTISIGGPSDITRVFMEAMLEKAGLHDGDWTYTYAGSTGARFAALVAGAIDATLLFPPFSAKAIAMGYPAIDEVPKYFPSFPFDSWAVRPQWAKEHPDLVEAFVRSHLQAVRWLYDPANRPKAIALLVAETNTSTEDATVAYDVFLAKYHYFSPTGIYGANAWNPVLAAMVKLQMLKSAPPAATLYDNTFVERLQKR